VAKQYSTKIFAVSRQSVVIQGEIVPTCSVILYTHSFLSVAYLSSLQH